MKKPTPVPKSFVDCRRHSPASEPPLILASRSPRRQELLAGTGRTFQVIPPDDGVEDMKKQDETPDRFVCRQAVQKARNVAEKVRSGRIIACDTIVVCQGEILGKPNDRDDAERMLRLLRGRRHWVLSGLCLLLKKNEEIPEDWTVCCEQTELLMLPIDDGQLGDYLAGESWRGKAGAFGYQDRNSWISIVRGSESNVVGLPMERLEMLLGEC